MKKALVLNDLNDIDCGGREDEKAAIQILLSFCLVVDAAFSRLKYLCGTGGSIISHFILFVSLLFTYNFFFKNCKFDCIRRIKNIYLWSFIKFDYFDLFSCLTRLSLLC